MSWTGIGRDDISWSGTLYAKALKGIFSGYGIIPVGSVLPWLKSFTNTPALPDGWVECSGQVLNDAYSIYNGQTIPNLNGSGGTKRFLRGSTTSGTTGGSETHKHWIEHCHEFCLNTNAPTTVACGADYNHIGTTANYSDYSSTNSTLPSYYEVVWIMRIK